MTNPYGPFIESGIVILRAKTDEANAHAIKLKTFGDTGSLVHEVRDEEPIEDLTPALQDKIRAYRQFADEVNNRLLAAQTEVENLIRSVDPRFDTENIGDEESIKADYKAAVDEIRNLTSTLTKLGATIPEDIPELVKVRGQRTSSSSATGTRRLRLSKIVVKHADGTETNVADSKGNVTNSLLAKYLNDTYDNIDVEVSTLTKLTLEAASSESLDSGESVTYTYNDLQITVTSK